MKRRNLRTLTLKAAAARTGLPVERLRRAVTAGEIAAFREPVKPGRHARTQHYLLEDSLETWFLARVHGGEVTTPADDAAIAAAVAKTFDVDDELLADVPPEERIFS